MRIGFAEITLCTLTWGTIGVLVRGVSLPSPAITLFRAGFGVAVVLAWIGVRGRLHSLRPAARPRLLVGSGVILCVHWVLQFEAFKRLEVGAAILIVFLGPVLSAALAPVVLNERLRGWSILALAIALTGIGLITVPSIDGIDGVGVLAALASAVLFGLLVLVGKLLTEHYESPAIVAWQLGIASILLLPVLAGTSTAAIGADLAEVVLLGAVMTGALGIVFFQALRRLQAQQVSVLFYLEPASAVFYAWWLLGERPSITTAIGGALIVLAGVAIISHDRTTAVPALPPGPVIDPMEETA